MFDWLTLDLASVVITFTVFAIAGWIAYGWGYRTGYDEGYIEAARDWQRSR